MTTGWPRRAVELATGGIEQKKRYRQYKARTGRLPESYRTAIDALQRYSYYFGGPEGVMPMLEDLIGVFEQGAARGIPIREIVGASPVEFADAFLGNYPQGQWIVKERERLTRAIDRAARKDTRNEGVSRWPSA
jgi:DNA-binding ferritin-like protein (Dps family)